MIKNYTKRTIGKCKHCKQGHVGIVLVRADVPDAKSSWVGGRPPRSYVTEQWPSSPACCGRSVVMTKVSGRKTETPCDDRCTEATGHKCECSCGGSNHGSGHSVL
jgi:hypothetical protein